QGIHAAAGLEVLLAEAAGGDGLEVSAEVEEALGVQRDAGGVAVTAEAGEVLGALPESLDEMEALDAPGAALPHSALDPDHQRGPVEALHDPGGDDADHARVPALGPEDETAGARSVLGLGDGLDEHLPLDGAPLLVGLVELARQLAGLGECRGREGAETHVVV